MASQGKSYQVGFVFGAKKASSFDKTFTGIKSSINSIGKATAVGLGIMGAGAVAAGAATIKLGTTVVKQFGELEQNLGGSEAVFGQYAEKIQKAGMSAYKNLGASQSDYLATANKMGALFQGSGIEQMKSLELTEKAMQRAGDMASVMGIDMQVALDSVAGAAKGNFTMMDNLGVAMNATNIQAYALEKGINFKWNTATQAEKAEVAMQMFFDRTEQYAGNFARESTETITGSIGMWKAAVGSFTAGLGNSNADMKELTGNVLDASKTVAANVIPIFKTMGSALPEALATAFPKARPVIEKAVGFAKSAFKTTRENGAAAIIFIKGKWEQYGPGIVTFFVDAKDRAITAFTWIRDTGQRAISGIQEKYVEIKPHIDSFIGAVMDAGGAIRDKLQGGFEAAKPVIEWVAITGFPAVVGMAGKVLGKTSDIYYFFKNNWPTIKSIVVSIGVAFAAWNLPNVLAGGINTLFALSSALVVMPGEIIKTTIALRGMVAAKIADKITTLQLCGLYAKDFFVAIWNNIRAVGASTASWVANKSMMIGIKIEMLALKGAQLILAGATTAMTVAQWALNAAFIASPIGWIVLGIGALVAIGVLLYKNWDVIKAKAFELWEGMKAAFGGLANWFGGIWESVKSGFKAFINFIIGGINKIPQGLNKLKFNVPDWVPGIGGESLGFSIPEIPMLAEGGIATKPITAVVGEGQENEAIMPLSKLQDMLNFNTGPIAALIEKFLSLAGGGASHGSYATEPTITYAPQFVFNGPASPDDVKQAARLSLTEFKRMYNQIKSEEKRRGLKN